jgi:UDP-N-acetylglucosamine/UDP-N-acetylgalactosamine diphosphorylase
MISFNGFEDIIAKVHKFKQQHIFQYWDELREIEKKILMAQLEDIDFDLVNTIYKNKNSVAAESIEFEPAEYIPLPKTGKQKDDFEKAKIKGREYIAGGKTAVLLVAGGQGTRLGFNGPKGILSIGPVSGKSLFRIHAEKILFFSKKNNISIPWLIMTSKENHEETVKYFNSNNYFGLKKQDVFFFSQKMLPSLDLDGKLLLKTKNSLCMNPDGHGGALSALSSSGILDELKNRKIDIISYFQVDNPLVNILDPAFIGFHILNGSDVSSKGVMKTSPDEKVGVFVKFNNGKTGIMEYSDLQKEKQQAVDNNGKLLFCMGSIAIHCFKVSFIDSVISGSNLLMPYHTAKKKIIAIKDGIEKEVDSLKFEKFIFDTVTLTSNNTILETRREEEFAPVKNADGVDSPMTAKELMSNFHRKWLLDKKISIPDNVRVIEISPLLAAEADELPDRIFIPAEEKVYIE